MNDITKGMFDAVALIVAFTTWFTSILPALASLASLIWAGIRIYEWIQSKRGNKNADVKLD